MRILVLIKKELLEGMRSKKTVILAVLFVLFGVMNPAVAKLTPYLMEMLSDQLAEAGMTVEKVTADASSSWVQFFKNVPMALIIYVLMCGGTFTKEYKSGTLQMLFTKGLKRYEMLVAKTAVLLVGWTLGYFLCFGITYGINVILWDNSIMKDLMLQIVGPWLFGLFVLSLCVFFSTVANGLSGVLLGAAGGVAVCYAVSIIPKTQKYIPTTLMGMTGENIAVTVTVTAILSVALLAASVPIMNKKSL